MILKIKIDRIPYYGRGTEKSTLFSMFENAIREKISETKIGTARAYRSTFSKIRTLTAGEDVCAEDITREFITELCGKLLRSGCCRNTASFYIRNLKAVLNRYYKSKIQTSGISGNLFSDISAKVEITRKRALTVTQMQRLLEYTPRSKRLQTARDIFFLCFFLRGTSLADICFMQRSSYDGSYLHFYRHKTSAALTIEVNEPARLMIKRHGSHREDSPYLLEFMDNACDRPDKAYTIYRSVLKRTNSALHELGSKIGLQVPLTTYVARHTWATQAKASGASIAQISEALGHSSQQITAIYLKGFEQNVMDNIGRKVCLPYKQIIEKMLPVEPI